MRKKERRLFLSRRNQLKIPRFHLNQVAGPGLRRRRDRADLSMEGSLFQLTSRFYRDRYPYRCLLSDPRNDLEKVSRFTNERGCEKLEPTIGLFVSWRLLLIPLPLCFRIVRGIVNGGTRETASGCGWPSLSSGKSLPGSSGQWRVGKFQKTACAYR